MKRVILATSNKGKIKEMQAVLGDSYNVISMQDAGVSIDVDETGTTFEENAILKAEAVAKLCNDIVIADDSGLEIDYLNGEPGIHSARYMGHDTSYDIKNKSILDKLNSVPEDKRTARFICAIAAAIPNKETVVVKGTMEGIIGYEIKGENGFGYDPIFLLPQYGKTSAEISPQEKNKISHRGKALMMIKDVLDRT